MSNITLDAVYLEVFGAAQSNISRGDTMSRNALAGIGKATKDGTDQPQFPWTDFVSPRGKSGFATLQVEQFDQVSETVANNLSADDKKLAKSDKKRVIGSRIVDYKKEAEKGPELPVAENALDYSATVRAAISTALGLAHDGLAWDEKGDLVKDEQAIATDFDLATVHNVLLELWKAIRATDGVIRPATAPKS